MTTVLEPCETLSDGPTGVQMTASPTRAAGR
jgi:hypothetical protein